MFAAVGDGAVATRAGRSFPNWRNDSSSGRGLAPSDVSAVET